MSFKKDTPLEVELTATKHQCFTEVDISSHVGAGSHMIFCCEEILKSGFFVQNDSNQGICAEILVGYRCALLSHARLTIWIRPNQMIWTWMHCFIYVAGSF